MFLGVWILSVISKNDKSTKRVWFWHRGWRSSKISAFQPQGPQFDLQRVCQESNIYVAFFSSKADSAFHLSMVGK
mgnify:CR=1 FL=1